MSVQDVRQILQYRLDHSKDCQEVYDLANNLSSRDEPDLIYDICRFAQNRLVAYSKTTLDFQARGKQIALLKSKPQLLTPEQKKSIELEEYIYNTLPNYMKLSIENNHSFRYKFSEMMIRTGVSHKNNHIARLKREGTKLIDDDALDRPLTKTIEEAITYITAPTQMLNLCRVLESSGYPRLGLPIADQAHKMVGDIKTQLKKRLEISVKIEILEQEAARLKKIKKELSKKQLEELADLKTQLDNFVMPFTDSMVATDVNAYEQMVLQIALMMIACAVSFKRLLMDKKKLVIQKKENFTKKEKEFADDPVELDNLVKRVISWAFQPGKVEDPSHMLQIAKNITEPDIPTAFNIGNSIIERLKLLKSLSDKKKKEKTEYDTLKEERDKQYAAWKLLTEDKQKILFEKEFQYRLTQELTPNYMNITKDKYEHLELSVAKFLLDTIYDRKDKFEDFVKNPTKYPNEKRLSTDQITAQLKEFSEAVGKVIEKIEDPLQLYQLATHVQSRKDSSNVTLIGEKCQKMISKIEELRETRAPIQSEYDALVRTKEDLLSRNRTFEKAQQERLDQLQKQLNDLPPFPEYSELNNYHQYDNLGLDIVRTMTSAILDNKTALEEDIARMFKETAPEDIDHRKIEKDRAAIQNSIRLLTKQCLTKFTNPAFLLKFAKDMKARKETEIVLEVVKKIFERIQEINAKRKVRKPIQVRIDELELAQEESKKTGKPFTEKEKEELASMKAKLDALPSYPYFSEVYKENEYHPTLYASIELALNAVLDDREAHESAVSKQYYEDRTSVDVNKIAKERKSKEENIEFVMTAATENILDLPNIQNLIKIATSRKESALALRLATHCFDNLKKIASFRKKKNKLIYTIEILTEEEKFLLSRKKSLDDAAKEHLTSLKSKLEKMNVNPDPVYADLGNEVTHLKIKDDLILPLIQTVYDKKAVIIKSARTDKDMTDERKQFWANYVTESEKQVASLLFKNISNPTVLLNISKILRSLNEFEFSSKVGEHCYNELSKIRKTRQKHTKEDTERKVLLEEEEQLHKVMKYLPNEKKVKLRTLHLSDKIHRAKPFFYQDAFDTDDFALELARHLVISSLDLQTYKPPELPLSLPPMTQFDLDIDIDMDEEEMEPLQDPVTDKPASPPLVGNVVAQKTDTIVRLCLRHIAKVPNLISLAKLLSEKHQYVHVIRAGKKSQIQINKRKQEFQKHEEIRQEYERLDTIRLQFLLASKPEQIDPAEKKELDEKLAAKKEEMERLPKIDVEAEVAVLDKQLLEVTELIIMAAKIENFEAELRTQTIMAFKANTTADRWDQVRQLISEDEWDKVKEELVIYVLKQTGNVKDKIDLLMKDGLHKQVIDIFPKPSGDHEELNLLLKVYKTIEEKDPTILEKMIPVVSRYMKRYYQEQKYEKFNPILDRFQRRFPQIVTPLLAHACDMVMFDILPSQYGGFVEMLKGMKTRLESINRQDDWNDFFLAFKKKHIGKKKLIQMVSLIGDSIWSLETLLVDRPAGKKSKRKSKGQGSNTAKTEEEPADDAPVPTKKSKSKKAKAALAAAASTSTLPSGLSSGSQPVVPTIPPPTKATKATKKKQRKRKRMEEEEEEEKIDPSEENLDDI